MGKHTQAIRRQHPTNYLSVFDHFVGRPATLLKKRLWAKNIHTFYHIRLIPFVMNMMIILR